MPSFSSHCPASDGRLAVGRFARGRQKAVGHKAPTIASNSFENRYSICNLLIEEPQRRLTSMENHSGPRRINPVMAHVEHCTRRGGGLSRSAQDAHRTAQQRDRAADTARRWPSAHSRRSGPASTSDAQPDPQRCRSAERIEQDGAGAADQNRARWTGRRARRRRGFRPGLKPQSLDGLFDACCTTKPSSMGMGLSICGSIIEAQGGRVWTTANVPKGARPSVHATPTERDRVLSKRPPRGNE